VGIGEEDGSAVEWAVLMFDGEHEDKNKTRINSRKILLVLFKNASSNNVVKKLNYVVYKYILK
jgi:hypothetical protein